MESLGEKHHLMYVLPGIKKNQRPVSGRLLQVHSRKRTIECPIQVGSCFAQAPIERRGCKFASPYIIKLRAANGELHRLRLWNPAAAEIVHLCTSDQHKQSSPDPRSSHTCAGV
ncbi:hypothetical protein MPTK1_5g08140 [Marchantia polymorpha subsp. ruderalis]|uniref:Uncharacterized protein n=2 Tax=Marchantia polymorpha TaxID=3197 RepID=A0AAF6BG51_MARPO|nr:hypothetical protein MARPO_0086s0018 [Marchantia polymorpha]BBN10985.1 hypothetical protein Mp_5g08140 [Marchantia polymorpha subsp. ruderalis]|eukprot:PTQ33683.1 hypothetical protein MARPO_0086s0018 [Marchantia polymorpha]